ncbi:hypothetical protein [Lysinibacillus sp. KU-BSD001]|uniref:hypothetical protein n=1 Tax=Lysinibacillus sp. KU-BSD001 TaxID=3141328 RepID=UPI0036F1D9B1
MKIFKVFVFFIMIALAIIIAERGMIYYVFSTSDQVYPTHYPLYELSPFVRSGVSAALVMASLWITYKVMQSLSFIKTKMKKNPY